MLLATVFSECKKTSVAHDFFETNYFAAVIVGIPMAVLYYFVFSFVIRKFDVQTPGRTEDVKEEISLSDEQLTKLTLDFVGGKDNLTSVTSCITRLRLEVVDTSLVNAKGLEDIGVMLRLDRQKNQAKVL